MNEVTSLKSFARIWNSTRTYPTNYDLERAIGKKIRTIRKMVDDYNTKRDTYPELPELVWRRGPSGQAIPVPAHALRQLDRFRLNRETLSKAKGFVVTSAQYGANLHQGFWDSLKTYADYRDFPLVVMPIKYGPVQYIGGKYTSTFPDELEGHVLFEDIVLGKDLIQLNVMRMRPTLENFLTDTVCSMGGDISQIFAAPILQLEHRPRVDHKKYPKAIMTTGAVSVPNYTWDKLGQQDRTAEVATNNHQHAAIVVEFQNGSFHFRQLEANRKGEFYDIDPVGGGARFFTPKGHVHKPASVEALVCGDWHTGKTDLRVRKHTFGPNSMSDVINPQNVVLHDFVDGDSVSHWEEHQASRRAWKAPKQNDSLEAELIRARQELEWIQTQLPHAKLHTVASNHPEFITRYIEDLKWVKDDINLAFGAKMFSAMVNNLEERNPIKAKASATDPVILYLRHYCPWANHLTRTDKLFMGSGKNLCSMHGDIGMRGAPTRSLKEYRKMNTPLIVAHNHTGTILGDLWRVGTSTYRMQFYVTTPSTGWTNTHCAVFDNGQRMLLNIVNDHWHGYKMP